MAEDRSKSNRILKRFGKYLLLDHFVDGGMAKICRARIIDEQATKIVAIKMIQPQFSKDAAFKKMFMDEVKVSFGLIHPNIAQTYDYGFQNEQLYTAMEYVDGKNLKQFLDKLKERNFVFPVELSVYIMTQVCNGLYYAHTFTDKLTGKKANIIHRDISPHNVMLTYDGAVKVIDFGIAKAESNSDSTQAGTIKGKLSYLAPEYIDNMALDSRYDQFAVGITLWEMLCSRKLFKAQNELAVLKLIQACQIPIPSSINPNVPKELDEIVMKALSKDRNQRYETVDLFARALNKFLYAHYPDFNQSDISYFANELFKEDIKRDREILFEYGKIDIKPFLRDMNDEKVGVKSGAQGGRKEEQVVPRSKIKELDFGFSGETTTPSMIKGKGKFEMTHVSNRSHLQFEAKGTQSRTKTSNIESTKTGTSLKLLEGAVSRNEANPMPEVEKVRKSGIKWAMIASFLLIAFGGYKFFGADKISKKEARMPSSVSTPAEEKKTVGLIILKNFNKLNQRIFINGKEQSKISFEGELSLQGESKYIVRVEDRSLSREHFVKEVSLVEKDSVVEIDIPEMGPMEYGFLVMSSACIRGKINFVANGEERSESLPFVDSKGIPFPVGVTENREYTAAKYNTVVIDDFGLERKISFVIKYQNDRVDLCKLL